MGMAKNISNFLNSINDKRIARALQKVIDQTQPIGLDTAITALAGGAQVGTQLKQSCAYHDVTTVATAADSVALPDAMVGEVHFVKNSAAANSMQVFAPTPGTIDGVATATGVPQPAGTSAIYVCVVQGNYIRLSGIDQAVVDALGGMTASAAELNYNDIATLGTLAASKTWTSDASLDTIMPTGGKLTVQSGGDITLESGSTLDVAGTFEIANVAMTASAAELNYNDIATLGTLAASKAWTSDASLDTVMPTGGLLTVQSGGAVTLNSGSTLTASGAIVQAPVFVADATPYTVLAADSGKLHIILEQTNSITLNLPVIAAGLSYKFVMGGVATEAQNWVIVATTPSFYNGGVAWTDTNAVASPVAVYGNGSSHLTLTVNTPGVGTEIEIYSNGTEWFVHGTVISDATPAFT